MDKAVAAYNAGPTTIRRLEARYGDKWATGLPQETKDYVTSVNSVLAGRDPLRKSGRAFQELLDSPITPYTDRSKYGNPK